ncbi:MAG: polymerase beta domain protein region [Herbinix sp.]|nr:polymerase beta domain protein region [Herbinix sp.]
MRTYESIKKVSEVIIADGLCEAILLKGSIGRGDDDEYSDVDMYVVVKKDCLALFLEKRMEYVAIYDNGLHFDLYTVTEDTLPHTDKAKVIYDPNHKFDNYVGESKIITKEQLAYNFNDALYYFIEADGAFCRKNYPWASQILSSTINSSAILLRYLYDKEYAYLGLKKINEIVPDEQFSWLMLITDNLNKDGFTTANSYIIKILDFVVENIEEDIKCLFNLPFFEWMKLNLNTTLFIRK